MGHVEPWRCSVPATAAGSQEHGWELLREEVILAPTADAAPPVPPGVPRSRWTHRRGVRGQTWQFQVLA